MSSAITIKKFAIVFSLYALGSFILHNLIAFTIPVGMMFFMFVLPFYGLCILYLIFLAKKHGQAKLRYRHLFVYAGAICQCLVLITSPRDCSGFNQGAQCTPPAGYGFAIAILLYLASLILVLITLKI